MTNLRPWKPIWESEVLGDWSKDLESISKQMSKFFGGPSRQGTQSLRTFWPATDITESPEGWRLKVDIPGVERDSVHLNVKDNILTIKGERNQESTEEGENWLRTERTYGAFERDFTLPTGVEDEKITANFKNGTLEVFVPKAPEEKTAGRKIPINE